MKSHIDYLEDSFNADKEALKEILADEASAAWLGEERDQVLTEWGEHCFDRLSASTINHESYLDTKQFQDNVYMARNLPHPYNKACLRYLYAMSDIPAYLTMGKEDFELAIKLDKARFIALVPLVEREGEINAYSKDEVEGYFKRLLHELETVTHDKELLLQRICEVRELLHLHESLRFDYIDKEGNS